jgi:hypothetical protein
VKITESKVRKIKIEDILNSHRLDPISVYLEDFEHGKGQITIKCYDKVWSSFWGGMGDRTISQFFCSCDNGYLIGNLDGNISSTVLSPEGFRSFAKKEIIRLRKEDELEVDRAREIYDVVEDLCDDELKDWFYRGDEDVTDIFGTDYIYDTSLPQEPNPKYEYLSRIIDTVKEVLKQE